MNVDGSSTPVVYTATPNTGKRFYVYRIEITMRDTAINLLKFGGITALTNGFNIEIKEQGSTRYLMEHSVKFNSEFFRWTPHIEIYSSGEDLITVTFNFTDTNSVIRLDDSDSDYIRTTISDDLTGLTGFTVTIHGYEVDEA